MRTQVADQRIWTSKRPWRVTLALILATATIFATQVISAFGAEAVGAAGGAEPKSTCSTTSGVIFDGAGEYASGATVSTTGPSDCGPATVIVDSEGQFSISVTSDTKSLQARSADERTTVSVPFKVDRVDPVLLIDDSGSRFAISEFVPVDLNDNISLGIAQPSGATRSCKVNLEVMFNGFRDTNTGRVFGDMRTIVKTLCEGTPDGGMQNLRISGFVYPSYGGVSAINPDACDGGVLGDPSCYFVLSGRTNSCTNCNGTWIFRSYHTLQLPQYLIWTSAPGDCEIELTDRTIMDCDLVVTLPVF